MRILGKEYDVINAEQTIMNDKIGLIDLRANKIYLADIENEDTIKETLLHEIIHAIEHSLGLDLSEQQVVALSSGLYSVAKENNFDMFKFHYEKEDVE